MHDEAELIPVFVPALGAILVAAEDKKSEPLTRQEVLSIRDNAACIMMTSFDAKKLAQSRGYDDIDPENCWYDWQMLRRELDRRPDRDPGARVDMVRSSDPAYRDCVANARATLDDFRSLIRRHDSHSCLIKTKLNDGQSSGFVWLFNTIVAGDSFTAELFEVPPSVSLLKVGQVFEVAEFDVIDWMVNDDGTLYGGYSLRYHRANLPPDERGAFDEYVGVTKYS
ncbi:DUF2314 domain-containing protein [Allorhodopirellula heiligendammensis]|uniref:DUF2314 domain-containing protein n=1 Tax=Allorhodopirellula heiligendammensis TaxID=2714739 RepID=A0A5C6BX02_9BACT|nr:DUF2314 domain-containing protein [Allorhodopirellula heiligendammensis]TWU15806.1 hypothetical protein Poly21_30080 [Allorhodopirellula heiligendammensis]